MSSYHQFNKQIQTVIKGIQQYFQENQSHYKIIQTKPKSKEESKLKDGS